VSDHEKQIQLERWNEFVGALERSPGMLLIGRGFASYCNALTGFDAGLGTEVMNEFAEWLAREQPDFRNFWCWTLVANHVVETPPATLDRLSAEEDRLAVAALFRLLRSFLEEQADEQAPR
jgi:hypothetical protein